jgi:hypothetical protein
MAEIREFHGVVSENYKIDGEPYTAIVNFNDGTGSLFGRRFRHYFKLDDYVMFVGNMEDFIKHHVKESKT